MRRRLSQITSLAVLTALLTIFSFAPILPSQTISAANEDTIEQLRKNIELKNAQVEAINQEIKILDGHIQTTALEGQTLKGAINTLESSRNKLLKEIEATQGKVSSTNLTIEQLGLEISEKQRKIENSKMALSDSLRDMNQAEDISLVESILAFKTVSEVWNEIEFLTRFQTGVRENMKNVANLKDQLAKKKTDNESQKKNLINLKSELEDKKVVVDINKNQKAQLLSATQNKEAAFKKQLEEKKRLSEAFLSEINSYEQQLKLVIDPNSYPSSGTGILAWPVANVFITQKFGNTEFAQKTNAYNGKGHNGIDFRATPGTNIMSAASGVIEGTGNTDAVVGCYSYGKWILVRHDNGLSTLYAHLSLIKATVGQRVNKGDVIGYSGNTGYSTGPHLHFGVYASQGVKIVKYENSINCKNAIIPVADIRAYLNPLLYL